ncbi:MAG TPA: hypothetical protein VFC19_28030 [Candidatus Limnocylindrales bacterium]|nr:hypothetical protein [Candidatus Limnocylindrales bacterium]
MPSLQHLVVVIPGIGGSVLRPPGKQTRSWDVSRTGLARTVIDPSRLHIDRELVPTDLITSCQVFPPFFTVQGYEDRIHQLLSRFAGTTIQTWRAGEPIRGRTDVLLFPYDFRRSIVEAAEHLDRAIGNWLLQIPQDRRAGRVVLLAHSLGGVVARYWLGPLGGHPWCKALITLGTPHRGAPKALEWLINGAVRDPVTEVLRGWPSVYELLPQYDAVLDENTGIPFELTTIPESMTSKAGYAPSFAKLAADARAVHERIFDAWAALDPDTAPPVIPYAGRGHATPDKLVLRDGRLRITKDAPLWRGNPEWRGDGTVPMISAIPRELSDDRHKHLWQVVPDRHLSLGCHPGPIKLLELYAGHQVPSRGGDLPDRPWLALDLDEIVDARTEWRVDAWIEPEPLAADVVRILVDPIEGGGVGYESDCLEIDRRWTVTVPPLTPGIYEVTVAAQGVAQVGRLSVTDVVAVLDEDGL